MSKNRPAVHRARAATVASGTPYTIRQLALMAGESDHVIRYYCRIGLLQPAQRTANGYRRFGAIALRHLRFIRLAQGLGFSLHEIATVMHRAQSGSSPCPEVRDILRRRVEHVAEQLQALVAMQERMRRALVEWEKLPDRAPSGDEICHLIEADLLALSGHPHDSSSPPLE